MSFAITELRPEQKLLLKNFEGYKLSLDTVPVIRNKLGPVQPNVIVPNTDQYSLLHATLYGFHNHLHKDPWEACTTYMIDSSNVIQKFVFNAETQRFLDRRVDFQFALPITENLDKVYNSSMKFVTDDYIVVCTGSNILYIIQTIERPNLNKWKTVFSESVVNNESGFVILDARLEETDEGKCIHCVLQHIEKGEKVFENVIDWIVLKQDTNMVWKSSILKKIGGASALHYCALEYNCKALYLASDKRYKFLIDKENKTEIMETAEEENDKSQISINWHQTNEEITLIVTFRKIIDKKLLSVCSEYNSVKISYNTDEMKEIILLSDYIDNDITTWNMLDASNLEIVLSKKLPTIWQSLAKKGQKEYDQIPNPENLSKVHEQLKHLCTEKQDEACMTSAAPIQDEIDDCDFDSDYDTKDLSLERLCPESNKSTHCVHIGSSAPLFGLSLEHNTPPILALRYDVDGLLWQMPKGSVQWPPKHIGTLPAFGYVLASKQEKKFVSCSPDFKYSVICNAKRHVFLYWGGDMGGQLQNRKSRQLFQVGVQKVVTLDDVGDIIGLQTENDMLTILTMNYILALQLNL